MLYGVLKLYSEIIKDYDIKKFRTVEDSTELVLTITFIDDSLLYVRDYVFDGTDRKYSFHWQDRDSNLIIRWDNQPHWRDIETFPHHCHIEGGVKASSVRNLESVLKVVSERIQKPI